MFASNLAPLSICFEIGSPEVWRELRAVEGVGPSLWPPEEMLVFDDYEFSSLCE